MTVIHYAVAHPVPDPHCSICIANFNGIHLLADCLASVFEQSADLRIEVIVHDDASTDNSVAWLRSRFPHVEVLASAENAGFCIANNRMVEVARGDYVLLLNNDAALYPDAVATLFETARLQAVPGILTLAQYDWESGELVDRGCLLDPFYNPVPNQDPTRTDVAMVIGACLFTARKTWLELGGFPEWMGSIAEDMYLCCAARIRSLPVEVAATSGYRHRQGASFGGNRVDRGKLQTTFKRRRLSETNKTATLLICTPAPWVWPLILIHLLALTLEGVALAFASRDHRLLTEIYGSAILTTINNTQDLRKRRITFQNARTSSTASYISAFTWRPRKIAMLIKHGLPTVK